MPTNPYTREERQRSKAGHEMATQITESAIERDLAELKKQRAERERETAKPQGVLDRVREVRKSNESALEEQRLIDEIKAKHGKGDQAGAEAAQRKLNEWRARQRDSK